MSISLDRYQELMTLPINAFNGLNKPDENPRYACSVIWKQTEREDLYRYLAQAQDMREKELGYFITPAYTIDEVNNTIRNPHILKNKFLLALGKLTIDEISYGEPVPGILHPTLTDDPITITIATAVTDVSEVHVYKKDSSSRSYEVTPSYKIILAGVLTLKIPRARLVDPDVLDDREDHLDYYDDANFVTELDIQREYADPAVAVIYERENCNSFINTSLDGYGIIKDNRLSIVNAFPASWSAGVPSPVRSCVGYSFVKLSYLSGKHDNSNLDLQTCRLAHTLMPHEPCTCDPVHQYWLADTEDSPEHIVTPYGSSRAGVFVWIADSRSKIGYSTTTGGILQESHVVW